MKNPARTPMHWTRFSYQDFFDDPAVAPMTNEEVGGYLRLLAAFHRAPVPGHLPNDDRFLAAVCHWTLEEWLGHREAIGRACLPHEGEWLQKRVIREHAECAERARVSSEYGHKGAAARWPGYSHPMQDLDVDLERDKEKDLESSPNRSQANFENQPVNGNGSLREGIEGVNRTKEAQAQIQCLAKRMAL